ncbi:MAG TPA: ATP-binding protein [Candidatus Hydrogenedentes bacterium]|nr:ATP-binding protein [Candidatus Hydrogenedentota bacterium]
MQTVEVKVQPDFIESLAKTKPLSAISELIWNSLDADAESVVVEFALNSMRGIDTISIVDDGTGIATGEAEDAFGRLGGSWKRATSRTKAGRFLHGKEGKGRFNAFALGKIVTWRFVTAADGRFQDFQVSATILEPRKFKIADPRESKETRTGTTVTIAEARDGIGMLLSDSAPQHISEHFALYLRQYPNVRIRFNGTLIDPSSAEEHVENYEFERQVEGRESPEKFKLTVIEWNTNASRALVLCDEEGFALHETKPGIHARGFRFTAYLRSSYLRELQTQGLLDLEDIAPDLQKILDAAKSKLRDHFRKREAAEARSVIEEWKQEKVYPYQGEPADVLETAERQVFEVVALNIHDYLPDFEEAELGNKRLALRLLRHALETRPTTIVRILKDVVNLPQEKQEEFVALLEKTSLEAIITASKVVTDRLDFLQGFSTFLFDKQSKKAVLERQQLQQILANEPWMFGEEYNLAQQEATLTEVLRRHYELLGKHDGVDEIVTRPDGTQGRVDLMFGAVTQFVPGKREHLIVELKRPARQIDGDAME